MTVEADFFFYSYDCIYSVCVHPCSLFPRMSSDLLYQKGYLILDGEKPWLPRPEGTVVGNNFLEMIHPQRQVEMG